jgi:hypothetical protein
MRSAGGNETETEILILPFCTVEDHPFNADICDVAYRPLFLNKLGYFQDSML